MSDPIKYTPAFDFSARQSENPSDPVPGINLDTELENIKLSISTIVDSVKDVRRADGKLKNGLITTDALDTLVQVGLQGPPGADGALGQDGQDGADGTVISYNGNAATFLNGTGAFSTPSVGTVDYTSITNKPTLFSGAYADLTGKPALFDGTYASLTGKPTPFSGSYTDLTNKPAFTVLATTTINGNAATFLNGTGAFSTVPTPTISYLNLTDKPTLFDGAYASLTGKPTLFDGTYTSLSGKPAFTVLATTALNGDSSTFLNGAGTFSTPVGGGGGGSLTTNSVTNAYLADVAPATIKGRATAGTGDPEDLTATQVQGILGISTFGATLAGSAAASNARTTLGLGGAATLSVGTGAGSVAAGDDSRVTGAAQKASNLSDLASASTARTNLGLGGAAVLSVGTTLNTVAAGDDSRIAGAAQKSANLSDLASAATARTNLGLGPLATVATNATATTYLDGTGVFSTPSFTPADGSVTNAKLANMTAATIKGRASGAGTGVPVDLSASQAQTILGISTFGASLVGAAAATNARSTLGLGGAAVLAVGTATGTVAAGDDSRITGAAAKANNLSDLANAATARTNLGIGSMATRAITVSTSAPTGGVDGDVWLVIT